MSPSSSLPILKHSTVNTGVGRVEIGEYYKLDGTKSWIDPTSAFTGTGDELQIKQPLGDRENGFALSFWAYLDKTSRSSAPSTLYNSGTAYDTNKVHVAIVLTRNRVLTFRGESTLSCRLLSSLISPFNYGLIN